MSKDGKGRGPGRFLLAPLFAPLLALVLWTSPAQAHKIVAAAYVEGNEIEGEIGFSNGDMAVGVEVQVLDGDGNQIAETTTDDDGVFLYTVTGPGPLVFTANLGAGHVARIEVPAEDLPYGSQPRSSTATAAPGAASPASGVDPATVQTASLASSGDLEKMIARAVAREVKPLRKEIAAYKEANDLQKILGGLGYICGITGVAFFFAARRRKQPEG